MHLCSWPHCNRCAINSFMMMMMMMMMMPFLYAIVQLNERRTLTYLLKPLHSQWSRSQTKRRHPCLSCAAATTSLQFIPLSCISLSRFRLQVFLGLPLLRCPSGFRHGDCFGIHVLSLCNVRPNHFHFLLFSRVDVGSCSVLFQSSSLLIRSGQLIFSILRKHLFMKSWALLIIFSDSFHVSDAYINIVFTLELNSLTLVRLGRPFDLHTFSMALKTPLAFPSRAFISSSVPRAVLWHFFNTATSYCDWLCIVCINLHNHGLVFLNSKSCKFCKLFQPFSLLLHTVTRLRQQCQVIRKI